MFRKNTALSLLIHVGIDTISMNGEGFSVRVKEGQRVKRGEVLLKMDLDKIKAAGHPATVIHAVTNSDDYATVELVASGSVMPGTELMCARKAEVAERL